VITLMAVGDVMLGRLVSQRAQRAHNLYPFVFTAGVLRKGDLVFGNLECPLSGRGVPNKHKSADLLLRAEPYMAFRLRTAGFNVLSLANNHVFDYGLDAFRDTVAALNEAGIRHVGAGFNECEARESLVLDVNGLNIAFLAYTYGYPARGSSPGCACATSEAIKQDLEAAKKKAHLVIVSLHDGVEFTDYPLPRIHALAHEMIDRGASLVVGHHPHTLQGIEEYKSGLIAYSLGDFVFDNADDGIREAAYRRTAVSLIKEPLALNDLRPLESVILECQLSEKGVESYQLIPMLIGRDFQPQFAGGDEGTAILGRISQISKPLHDPKNPIWEEMAWLERKVGELGLGKITFMDIIRNIGKLRLHHFKYAPIYLQAKLSRLVKRSIGGR